MSRPRLVLFLFAFCAGVAAGEIWVVPIVALAAAAASAIASMRWPRLRLVGIMLFGIVSGMVRTQQAMRITEADVSVLIGRTTEVVGSVVLPASIDGSAQRFELVDVSSSRPHGGKLLISAPAIPVIRAGTRVRCTCVINGLSARSLRRQWSHGVHATCATPAVHVVSEPLSGWRALLGRWQERVIEYVRRTYNEPQASLLNGILIGNTNGMPASFLTAFQATGTSHIVALSGFNVTIIMTMVVRWFVRIVGRRWAWLPALMLLIGFVIMSGASASVTRAAVMAVIVHLGLFVGRPIAIGRLLAYTGLVMIWTNPLMLYHDLGFQLSFLATYGLVAVAGSMADVFRGIPERFGFRENLSSTLSAIVATEPLLLWRFGRLSLVAPVVNLLVLPLIPLAMAVGALSLVGLMVPILGQLFVPMTDAVLRLVLWCIAYGASIPFAMASLSLVGSASAAMLCVLILVRLSQHHVQETLPSA